MDKGNIVRSNKTGKHGIVLALTKDGERCKVYVYGPDAEVWRPIEGMIVVEAGLMTCHKCLGSGLYYFGGAVVNGSYTGQTGPCYACQGKGKQTDDDRVRCHYYWHRQREIEQAIEDVERTGTYTPLSIPWMAPDETVAELHGEPEPVAVAVADDAPPF